MLVMGLARRFVTISRQAHLLCHIGDSRRRYIAGDSANPVYPLLDPTRVYRAIENKDTDKLSKLLGINLWLSQYEAEILPF